MENKKNDEELVAIIEGLLFISGSSGLLLETICASLNLSNKKRKVLLLIEKLKIKLNEDSLSGLIVIKLGELYKLATKPKYHKYYQILQNPSPIRLSQAALETLAIIAYNQPTTKTKIEEIRGVNCDGVINKLKKINFIKEQKRSEHPGRPFYYCITNEFMDHFQLESLEQLPDLPNFKLEEEKEIYNFTNEN